MQCTSREIIVLEPNSFSLYSIPFSLIHSFICISTVSCVLRWYNHKKACQYIFFNLFTCLPFPFYKKRTCIFLCLIPNDLDRSTCISTRVTGVQKFNTNWCKSWLIYCVNCVNKKPRIPFGKNNTIKFSFGNGLSWIFKATYVCQIS